jgi:hypothetical protein
MPWKLFKKEKLKNLMFYKIKKLKKLVKIYFLLPFDKLFKMIVKSILSCNICQKVISITIFVENNVSSQNK